MKESFKIIGIVVSSLVALFLVILLGMWIFSDPFNWIPDDPIPKHTRAQCLIDKADTIYANYAQCVKDAQGNNVRCQNSAEEIICPYALNL